MPTKEGENTNERFVLPAGFVALLTFEVSPRETINPKVLPLIWRSAPVNGSLIATTLLLNGPF